jgi:hypothetical protein
MSDMQRPVPPAGRPPQSERVQRWITEHKLLAACLGAIALAVIVAVVVSASKKDEPSNPGGKYTFCQAIAEIGGMDPGSASDRLVARSLLADHRDQIDATRADTAVNCPEWSSVTG